MPTADENPGPGRSPASAVGFVFVWIAGIVVSLVTLRLAISGTLWDLGFPSWLITLIVLVGLWQWIWIAPVLAFARRRDYGLYSGFLRGGITFSVLQLSVCVVLYFLFRHVSLQ